MHVFEECFRTLKPGASLRVSVPDIDKYMKLYRGEELNPPLGDFPSSAVAISFITQMHFHRSTWNADLMTKLLAAIGFVDVAEVAYQEGTEQQLVRDDADKRSLKGTPLSGRP